MSDEPTARLLTEIEMMPTVTAALATELLVVGLAAYVAKAASDPLAAHKEIARVALDEAPLPDGDPAAQRVTAHLETMLDTIQAEFMGRRPRRKR